MSNGAAEAQPRRSSSKSKLDTGQQSFTNFIGGRLDSLRDDLVKECNRMVRHELDLRSELEKKEKKNVALQQKIVAMQSGVRADVQNGGAIQSVLDRYGLDLDAVKVTESSAPSSRVRASLFAKPGWHFYDNDLRRSGKNCSLIQKSYDTDKLVMAVAPLQATDLKGLNGPVTVTLDDSTLGELELQGSVQEGVLEDFQKDTKDGNFELWPEWTSSMQSISKPSHSTSSTLDENHLHRRQHSMDFRTADEKSDKVYCVVSPNSCFALSWDFCGVPLLLYDLVTLPLQVFWKSEDDMTRRGQVGTAITWCITFYWSLDLVLRLFVIGFVTRLGKPQLQRRLIAQNYLRKEFLFDFLMIIPDWASICFDLPRRFALLRVLKMMRFMRITRMSKLKRTTRRVQEFVDSEYFSVYTNATWSILVIMGCCHYLACLWWWVGVSYTSDVYPNWITSFSTNMQEYGWQYQYLTSLHWAVCQFTPGSMRVQPANPPERLVAIFVLIWGMVFFSLFVSSITQERLRLQALNNRLDKDTWTLRRYLKQCKLPTELSVRVVEYVDAFVAPRMMRVQRKDVNLMDSLSRPLQKEVQVEIHFQTLSANPFFANLKAQADTIAAHLFFAVVSEMCLAKNDLLFDMGQISHDMLFVSTGEVGYFSQQHSSLIHVCPGDWFCEPVLWVPWMHKGESRSATESNLLAIDAAKFRTGVWEFREAAYVKLCAHAYLQDLEECILSGILVDDLIHMDKRDRAFRQAFTTDINQVTEL